MSLRVLCIGLAAAAAVVSAAAQKPKEPLKIARLLAARYPESPIMSYIPGVAWSASLRLAQLTGEEKWKDKPRRDMQAFCPAESRRLRRPTS